MQTWLFTYTILHLPLLVQPELFQTEISQQFYINAKDDVKIKFPDACWCNSDVNIKLLPFAWTGVKLLTCQFGLTTSNDAVLKQVSIQKYMK